MKLNDIWMRNYCYGNAVYQKNDTKIQHTNSGNGWEIIRQNQKIGPIFSTAKAAKKYFDTELNY